MRVCLCVPSCHTPGGLNPSLSVSCACVCCASHPQSCLTPSQLWHRHRTHKQIPTHTPHPPPTKSVPNPNPNCRASSSSSNRDPVCTPADCRVSTPILSNTIAGSREADPCLLLGTSIFQWLLIHHEANYRRTLLLLRLETIPLVCRGFLVRDVCFLS